MGSPVCSSLLLYHELTKNVSYLLPFPTHTTFQGGTYCLYITYYLQRCINMGHKRAFYSEREWTLVILRKSQRYQWRKLKGASIILSKFLLSEMVKMETNPLWVWCEVINSGETYWVSIAHSGCKATRCSKPLMAPNKKLLLKMVVNAFSKDMMKVLKHHIAYSSFIIAKMYAGKILLKW